MDKTAQIGSKFSSGISSAFTYNKGVRRREPVSLPDSTGVALGGVAREDSVLDGYRAGGVHCPAVPRPRAWPYTSHLHPEHVLLDEWGGFE